VKVGGGGMVRAVLGVKQEQEVVLLNRCAECFNKPHQTCI